MSESGHRGVSIYRPTQADIKRAHALQDEFCNLIGAQIEANEASQKRAMRIGSVALQIQDGKLWLLLKSKESGKPFRSFDQWLREKSGGVSRSTIFDAILSWQQLRGLPKATAEQLGVSKSVELARVQRDAPERFKAILRAVTNDPEMTVKEVRDMVTTELVGGNKNGTRPTRWTRMEFALKEDDAAVVRQALIVANLQHPVDQPDTPYALGTHLKSICEEFLTGEDQRRIWKKLDGAGAFTGTRFKLE